MPDLNARDEGNFFCVIANEPGEVAEKLVDLVAKHILRRFGFDRRETFRSSVRCSAAGPARALDALLQPRLNPSTDQVIEKYATAAVRATSVDLR